MFDPIGLDKMDQVKFMNRVDKKFWLHSDLLPELFDKIKDSYYVLDIDGKQLLPYTSTYYDTYLDDLYKAHHNGKLNRVKIRRRTYISSGISFLEIKLKNNKGRTFKNRIPCSVVHNGFLSHEASFIEENTAISVSDLQEALKNEFTRITLVNKNFTERCTFDLNLQYFEEDKNVGFKDLLVIEVKSEGKPKSSPLVAALNEYRIKASGFSKYCIGRSVLNTNLKRNAFKPKLRMVQKILNKNLD
jgi:hypothetical protein